MKGLRVSLPEFDYSIHLEKEGDYYAHSGQFAKDQVYWNDVVACISERTSVNLTYNCPEFSTQRYEMHIDSELNQKILDVCAKYDITEVALILSLFAYKIAKFLCVDEVSTYFAVANRRGRAEKKTAGMFGKRLISS